MPLTQQFMCYPYGLTSERHGWTTDVDPEFYSAGVVPQQCPEHDAPEIAPTEGE